MWELAWEVTGDEKLAMNMVSGRHEHHDIIRWPCYMDAVRIVHTHCINLAQVSLVWVDVACLVFVWCT